jgi:hypothetical protein
MGPVFKAFRHGEAPEVEGELRTLVPNADEVELIRNAAIPADLLRS